MQDSKMRFEPASRAPIVLPAFIPLAPSLCAISDISLSSLNDLAIEWAAIEVQLLAYQQFVEKKDLMDEFRQFFDYDKLDETE